MNQAYILGYTILLGIYFSKIFPSQKVRQTIYGKPSAFLIIETEAQNEKAKSEITNDLASTTTKVLITHETGIGIMYEVDQNKMSQKIDINQAKSMIIMEREKVDETMLRTAKAKVLEMGIRLRKLFKR